MESFTASAKPPLQLKSSTSKMCNVLINIISFGVLAPFFTLFLISFWIYRCIVECALRLQYKDRFVGFLSGTDNVWAIESSSSLSIINVMAILEKEPCQANINILQSFRELMRKHLTQGSVEKLRFRRSKKYGYYFWERCDTVDLSERVRWLHHQPCICDGFCDNVYSESVKRAIQNMCNKPLPQNHSAPWEILIGKQCSRSNSFRVRGLKEGRSLFGDRVRSRTVKIPVLFRIHHSLGDGMSLVKLLVESFADENPVSNISIRIEEPCDILHQEEKPKDSSIPALENDSPINLDTCTNEALLTYYKDFLNVSMPFSNFIALRIIADSFRRYVCTVLKLLLRLPSYSTAIRAIKVVAKEYWAILVHFLVATVCRRIRSIAETASIYISIPTCLVKQAIRSMDCSVLHGPKLTGDKLLSCWMESDFRSSSSPKLLFQIQDITRITGASFGDVVLAALSSSLHNYFLRVNEAPPDCLTVVLPRKMMEATTKLTLENNFSVELLSLCISKTNEQILISDAEDSQILTRLYDIIQARDELQKSSDYLINYWVMKFLSSMLPECFLRPLFKSYSTMIFSNLPGPQEIRILDHRVKNIVFWIPNRSTTGIGCSVFTYAGSMHLSIIADKALVKNETRLSEILQNMVRGIDNLYNALTLSRFSRKFQVPLIKDIDTAAMKKEISVLRR